MMKVAIIHYHLNRGGVTHVIVNHLRAMNSQLPSGRRQPVALLAGGRCTGWQPDLADDLERLEISTHTVAELDYDNVRPKQGDLAARLRSTLEQAGFGPRETVLHIHNHALGKNVALPGAVAELAREGYGALLHLHDFAEDFRPANYGELAAAVGPHQFEAVPGWLYPQAPQVHYAVLNSRDQGILRAAGVAASRLHLLPNAVADMGPLPPREEARAKLAECFGVPPEHRFVLYPVRGIRRKNLGEALLWSALADRHTSFGLTLPPLNPIEQSSYQRWRELAVTLGLPWVFEVGGTDGLAYAENLAAADLLLTTSVAEGFGLVFLECWLAGRRLVGRDLPEVTADFVATGLRFPGLQPNLLVPAEWLPAETFRAEFATAYRVALASYGQTPPASLDHEIAALVQGGLVDFARCGVATQRRVIARVAGDANDRQRLLAINPGVRDGLARRHADTSLVEQNSRCVRTEYALPSCGRRLLKIYDQVTSSDRAAVLQPLERGDLILDRFLSARRFQPLRIES